MSASSLPPVRQRAPAERRAGDRRSTTGDEIADIHSDVACDHPEERGRDVTPRMERHSGRSSIRVTILSVGATLPYLREADAFQNGRDLARLQDGDVAHD